MGPAVYILGTLITFACGFFLMRGYIRTRHKLLVWSAICFFGLAISNLLVFVDLVLLPDTDLYLWRLVTAALAMMFLLYGLIWEGSSI
jgi:hypothetical protein